MNLLSPKVITTLNELSLTAIMRAVFPSKVSHMVTKTKIYIQQQYEVLIHMTTILDTQSVQAQLNVI